MQIGRCLLSLCVRAFLASPALVSCCFWVCFSLVLAQRSGRYAFASRQQSKVYETDYTCIRRRHRSRSLVRSLPEWKDLQQGAILSCPRTDRLLRNTAFSPHQAPNSLRVKTQPATCSARHFTTVAEVAALDRKCQRHHCGLATKTHKVPDCLQFMRSSRRHTAPAPAASP